MPSVVMSCPLPRRVAWLVVSVVEVRVERGGDQGRQRRAGLDRVVFDLFDQRDRQIDVELLDRFVVHSVEASILVSYGENRRGRPAGGRHALGMDQPFTSSARVYDLLYEAAGKDYEVE